MSNKNDIQREIESIKSIKLKDLSFIRDIKSIAIIGASKKRNFFFVRTFYETFKGKVYAINPRLREIPDLPEVKVYSKVSKIPIEEKVDFVFITVPRELVKSAIEDCIKKGVKLAAIFTADFADENTEIGKKLQEELIEATKGKINILGPNGMGLYYPAIGLRWRASLPIKPGSVGIVAQSGGLCNLMIHSLTSENVGISKAFSIGNAADVNIIDILNYFSEDKETEIIVAYIEGIPEGYGQILMNVLKKCVLNYKPVLIIKAGRSKVGIRAAFSHTASIAGNFNLWKNAIKQSGAILISNLEEMINTVKLFIMLNNQIGFNLQEFNTNCTLPFFSKFCLSSLSGGYGVICSDLLYEHGITLPSFKDDEDLYAKLSVLFTAKGTSYNNPMDLAVMIYETEKLLDIFKLILNKKYINGLIFEIASLYVAHSMKKDTNLKKDLVEIVEKLIQNQKYHNSNNSNSSNNSNGKTQKLKKPILVIMQNLGYDEIEKEMKSRFQKHNIPVFRDISILAESLEKYNNFFKRIAQINNPEKI
ncbi:MAG: CoA-binding protein [Promethearchaeota archaeon]